MTDKELVRKRYPRATVVKECALYRIVTPFGASDMPRYLSPWCSSPDEAWITARQRLTELAGWMGHR